MKLAVLLVSIGVHAQTLTLVGPSTIRIGATAVVSLRLSGTTSTGPVSLQWQSTLPNGGYTLSSPTSAVAGKSITCQNYKCLLSGMNQTALGNGTIATFNFNLPRQMSVGYASVTLSNVVGASRAGGTMNIARGTTYTFYVRR